MAKYVNAVITIYIPIRDVAHDASDDDKWEATHKEADKIWELMPEDSEWVGTEHWEIIDD